ncbi:MAG: hypothetical protein DMD60_12555 [Gemmatimonadetes bacterium]|nr:MAG: hypothetical protein DMD60_12555 [Gemmatimonadota bacterium]
MLKQINVGFVSGLAAATLLAWGCDRPATPSSPKPSFWTGGSGNCPAGEKFTGGGRIDPPIGKTTFGFNVNARDFCESDGSIKGELQTVYHPTHTRIHSLTIDQFFSFQDAERGGRCAVFGGTARVKDGNGSWVQEEFAASACDNGEPGSSPGGGPDRYGIALQDDRHTGTADLTGGNIQAH